METINIDSIKKWKEELSIILGQHIYKQNHTLRKIKVLSEYLTEAVSNSSISYETCAEERKVDLYEHLIFTSILSIQTALKLNLDKETIKNISFGCLIHDIGLRYINVIYEDCDMDEMSPREIYELKNHTILGYTSLEKEEWIPRIIKNMVLSHHETMDGTGYPLKQKNQEIECRIVQICDSVDRIISGIEGKKGSLEDAINEIFLYRDKKYDSIIVDAVLEIIDKL